ncbi:unnamed protein product [Gordionus sp. m RMFG-2023]
MDHLNKNPSNGQSGNDDVITNEYNPPLQRSINDIISIDKEDESLQKYKEKLLGEAVHGKKIILDKTNMNFVLPKSLTLIVEDRPDRELDLSGDLSKIKNDHVFIKEGAHYALKINFYVQREMVYGLKYVQTFSRKGIKVDKTVHMIGCYGPKNDLQHYTTPIEEAPSGLLARGTYNVKSIFIDDDKREHLRWEWVLEIKKDWDECCG